jgi:hypothetical protein
VPLTEEEKAFYVGRPRPAGMLEPVESEQAMISFMKSTRAEGMTLHAIRAEIQAWRCRRSTRS